jgi:hypothetical protein
MAASFGQIRGSAMGIFLSRRCYRCKSVVGWNANLCSYCQFRSGNEEGRSSAIGEIEPEPVYDFGPADTPPRQH